MMMRVRGISQFKELLALYGVQGINLLLPLLTLPILSRLLIPSDFGLITTIQALFFLLSVIIEYGVMIYGTVFVAKNRDDEDLISSFFQEVVSSKIILVMLYILVSYVVYMSNDVFYTHSAIYWNGCLYGIFLGIVPFWYFQGISNLSKIAGFSVVVRVFSICISLLIIKLTGMPWIYLLFLAIGSIVTLIYAVLQLKQDIRFRRPTLVGAIIDLRRGLPSFFYRILAGAVHGVNGILLSYFVTPSLLGIYNGADRIASGSRSFVLPLNQFYLPKISKAVGENNPKISALYFFRSLTFGMVLSFTAALLLYFLSDQIITIVLGPGYSESAHLLKIFAVFLPIFTLNSSLGLQWLIPNSKGTVYNQSILGAFTLNIALLLYLIPKSGIEGAALSFGISEVFTLVYILFQIFRSKGQDNLFFINVRST